MSNRPFLLRLVPDRYKAASTARLYRPRAERWRSLYTSAPLRFTPDVTMELVPGDVISDHIAFTGFYELEHTRALRLLAGRGGTLLDIGANLGYFSLLWAAASPGNRCVAVEASPRNVPLLKRNVERNGLGNRVRVVDSAAGEQAGKLMFSLGPLEQTGWGGFVRDAGGDAIEVDVVRADDLIGSSGDVDLLKIDIEGADTWALRGCEALLRARRVRVVWYEQNKPRMRALGIDVDDARDFLARCGYRAEPQDSTSLDCVAWAATPE